MRLLTKAFAAATLLGAIATTVAAQTTSSPAPGTTHPNTKVYAYKKSETAPPSSTSPAYNASPNQMTRDPDVPAHGSQKWWEQKGRFGHGDGGN
jgi:hypothetical protein